MLSATDIALYNRDFVYACNMLGLTRPDQLLGDLLNGLTSSFAAPAADLAALRLILAADRADKQIRLVEATGALYRFDSTGTGADDGAGTIVPSDVIPPAPGRWFRVSASWIPPYLIGTDPDSGTAVSVIVDSPAYSTPGAKLLSVRNNSVEKAFVDYEGYITCGALTTTASGSSLYVGSGTGGIMASSMTCMSNTVTLTGIQADGPTALGLKLVGRSSGAWANPSAKIASFYNYTTERAYVLGGGTIGCLGLLSNTADSLILTGSDPNGSSAVGVILDNNATFYNPGAKPLSVRNNGTEIFSIGRFGTTRIGDSSYLAIHPQEATPSVCVAGDPTAGGAITDGTHSYKYTFVTPDGESLPSAKSNVITCGAGNNTVALTSVRPGSTRCTSRKIYRTDAGDAGDWKLVGTIANNTTTTFTDTIIDGAGAAAPTINTTSNCLISSVVDSAGARGLTLDTVNALTGSSILLNIRNNGVDKLSIYNSGTISSGGAAYLYGVYSTVYSTNGANPLELTSTMPDGPTAIAVKVNSPAYVNPTSKIISYQNNSVEKAYIMQDGTGYYNAFATTAGGVSLYVGSGGGGISAASLTNYSGTAVLRGTPAVTGTAVEIISATTLTSGKIVAFKTAESTEVASINKDGNYIGTAFLGDGATAFSMQGSQSAYLVGTKADVANAVGVILNNSVALTDTSAKLVSIRNATVEKASVDLNGSLALSGGIKGQKDILTTLTPVDAGTVTIVYGTGNAWVIDVSALNDTHACTVALSGAPNASFMSSLTIVVKTGATIPTITWPASYTVPALAAASENWLTANSIDGGTTTRVFLIGSF